MMLHLYRYPGSRFRRPLGGTLSTMNDGALVEMACRDTGEGSLRRRRRMLGPG